MALPAYPAKLLLAILHHDHRKPGDVLFATDLTGQGHITRTLTNGRSIIIAADEIA